MAYYYWPQPDADTRREHRVRWFVWSRKDSRSPLQCFPHTSSMYDPDFGRWDAECTCGQWESKTGGIPRPLVQDMIEQHRSEVQLQRMYGEGLCPDWWPDAVVLGEGLITWSRGESVSGRYGTVVLRSGDIGPFLRPVSVPEGSWGTLRAEVLELLRHPDAPRTSQEIQALGPGSILALGEGYLFCAGMPSRPAVGVRPSLDADVNDEQAGTGWMDSSALFRVRAQLVRLTFTPGQKGQAS